ncbi:MAG: RsmE family RNA methyltransferase [Eubacteriales bacterium]|nr:RsmE family RNA methyltransferase [Eubacteriales bacterium]
MNRFFTTDILQNGTARISGDDVKHITKVLRLRAGDEVEICDERGKECEAKIVSIMPSFVILKTGEWKQSNAEPEHKVTLFQCIPKAGKMETIIQKCVELGIMRIIPVQSARCVALPKGDFERRLERYQRVSLEASKQSKRGFVPQIKKPELLETLDLGGFDTVIVAYEGEKEASLKSVLRGREVGGRIAIIVGPEGGFEPSEIDTLSQKGAIPVTLGNRILRTETAGMAILAQVMYEVE